MSRPKVLVLVDVPGWAWAAKAEVYARYLSDEFDIQLAYYTTFHSVDLSHVDLLHCFEVKSLDVIPQEYPGRLVAGLTAHVWKTWGLDRMLRWTQRCHALHGNSRLLVKELQSFHPTVTYLPNGVDADFWTRTRSRALLPTGEGFRAGHVGKPTPRKGASLIIEACQRAQVPLHLIQRTAHIRLSPEEMREWYQDLWLLVTCSDLDGTPNPMLEAASCEVALLSNPIGNMPEFLVPYGNGLTVPYPVAGQKYNDLVSEGGRPWYEDPKKRMDIVEDLEQQLVWARTHSRVVEEMGRQARRDILTKGWTWEAQVEHVRRFWRDVLAGKEGRPNGEEEKEGQEGEQTRTGGAVGG